MVVGNWWKTPLQLILSEYWYFLTFIFIRANKKIFQNLENINDSKSKKLFFFQILMVLSYILIFKLKFTQGTIKYINIRCLHEFVNWSSRWNIYEFDQIVGGICMSSLVFLTSDNVHLNIKLSCRLKKKKTSNFPITNNCIFSRSFESCTNI